ncbi:alanine racemase [Neorhizobium sp. NCHU2750]|uniref:alanine racemase n=1 Tax=Neorhizobium sp. NCHU2750 TaxID=1825976 RepID=UPI000EB6856E|nr:alanine racemase [Neorhizobium sp. NCHU2750]
MLNGAGSRPLLQVDLGRIRANYAAIVAETRAEVAAVVKDDAYGLGLSAVSRSLYEAGCRSFFVADLSEAVALRKILPDGSIYLFNPTSFAQMSIYIEHRLIPVCNRLDQARGWVAVAGDLPLAIEVETGLHRFGLNYPDLRHLKQMIRRRPDLLISHLASADHPDAQINQLQRNRFLAAIELLRPERASLIASTGLGLPQSFHFDLVRAGSLLYGLKSGRQDRVIQSVVRLTAKIINVQSVAKGEGVGYAAAFRTQRSSLIALVAIGYSHGLPFACANRLTIGLGVDRAPLVGRIAMDYVAADITDLPRNRNWLGEMVDLIHVDQTVEDIAQASHASPQELLLRFGNQTRRIYRDERRSAQTT